MVSTSTRTVVAATICLSLVGNASAFWRLQCEGILGVGRLDPIINPGDISGHVHTIKGGNGFGDNATYQDLLASKCTSCQVKQDKSAYWTSQLYFKHKDSGKMEIVKEVAGHLSYYKFTTCQVGDKFLDPIAMPNGLTMISGDPFRRNMTIPEPDPPRPWRGEDATQSALAQKAIGFNCLKPAGSQPEDSLMRHKLPEKSFIDTCTYGLRLELLFPQCWNGKDLDSTDHKSHMAFPDQGINGGKCPDGFPKVLNQLFFETIYDTQHFFGVDGDFVLSNGDPTGFGYHGDVIVAWDEGVLQAATEQCGPVTAGSPGENGDTEKCPVFQMVDTKEQSKCKIEMPPQISAEDVQGPFASLPGKNEVLYGPAYAKPAGGTPPPAQKKVEAKSVDRPADKKVDPLDVDHGTAFNVQQVTTPSSTVASSSAATSTTSSIVVAPAITSTSTLVAQVSPAPPPTTVPVAPPQPESPNANIAYKTRTTTYTQGNDIVEMVIIEEEVVVVVNADGSPYTPKQKRGEHLLQHQHLQRSRRRHAHHRRGGSL